MTRRDLQFRAVGILGKVLLGLYFPFVRCFREGEENFLQFRRRGEPVIFVFWHGQLLPLIHYHRNEGVVVLVSDHADGEYVTRVILRHGFDVARGSSTRGGVKGLKGIVRSIQAGNDLAFTPDGPKGPRHHFKWGAILAAQLSGAPIIPIFFVRDGQDRFDLIIDEPIYPPANTASDPRGRPNSKKPSCVGMSS